MSKSDIPKTLRDLRKKGFEVPGLDKKGMATIPAMPAMVRCPTCDEKIPIFVQVQNLTFAVSYPKRKEDISRRVRNA
ncbi:hypothetical protein ES708_13316 [subsurface metagenome]